MSIQDNAATSSSHNRPVTTHHLKLKEQYVRPILECKMRYQVRFDDRGYQAGDEIEFSVVGVNGLDEKGAKLEYCNNDEIQKLQGRRYRIDHVMTFEGLAPGYVVFSISEK